ncbi:unnamed protein product [Prorocentrum cordatum]|uniref:Cyclic nucleotide-binding domain-containing protein n=1 Tax=Prorocentrum cordatum TaxID=2364126 RepID=A0ABN9PTA5_9DINO|nr:unnamed protein product [Polarella glacialis]
MDRGKKVASLTSGMLMNHLAFMDGCPQSATVVSASTSLDAWCMPSKDLRLLLQPTASTWEATSEGAFIKYQGWLSEVDLLGFIDRFELSELSLSLDGKRYGADEEIIREGEPGSRFYILQRGTAVAFKEGVGKVKEYCEPGEYFGELALIREQPRAATVSAGPEGCTVGSLSKQEFLSFLGPVRKLIKREVDVYYSSAKQQAPQAS